MQVGDKVFIDHIFKNGYVYSYDSISMKYKIVVIDKGINRFYDAKKQDLYVIQKGEFIWVN